MLNILVQLDPSACLRYGIKQASFPKNHHLHREGAICNHLYLVKRGMVRSYYHKDGKDITAHFAAEGEVITAIDSFIQRKSSRYNLELLEASALTLISHQGLATLLEENPQYEREARAFLEQIYIELAERVEDLLFHNAKDRYRKLIENRPSLLQKVSLSHIASYLGITQETLSRIRSQP